MNHETSGFQEMPQYEGNVKDPVCGMLVAPDQHAIMHQQMHFAFCSAQCRDRFIANPHLYIGHRGHKAPTQEGRAVLKHRRMKLDEPLPHELVERVITHIKEMMGIERIEITDDTIDIRYDLLQVTEAQIESALAEVGATLNHRWSDRLRRSFVQYFEETEISSLEAPTGAGGHHH